MELVSAIRLTVCKALIAIKVCPCHPHPCHIGLFPLQLRSLFRPRHHSIVSLLNRPRLFHSPWRHYICCRNPSWEFVFHWRLGWKLAPRNVQRYSLWTTRLPMFHNIWVGSSWHRSCFESPFSEFMICVLQWKVFDNSIPFPFKVARQPTSPNYRK